MFWADIAYFQANINKNAHTNTQTHKHSNEVGTNSGVNSKYEFVDIALKE